MTVAFVRRSERVPNRCRSSPTLASQSGNSRAYCWVVRLQLRPPAHTIKRVLEIRAPVLEKADEAKDMIAGSPAGPHQMLDQVVFVIKTTMRRIRNQLSQIEKTPGYDVGSRQPGSSPGRPVTVPCVWLPASPGKHLRNPLFLLVLPSADALFLRETPAAQPACCPAAWTLIRTRRSRRSETCLRSVPDRSDRSTAYPECANG
ncbi:MAG: hypothetical protein QOK06_2980 [Acidimicrobiaceae bacterium]